ncbi:MAG: ribonuclease HII [Caldilineaceae bacterium]
MREEMRLWNAGFVRIAGIDEAGRGALAGPVVAAAVVLPPQSEQRGLWAEVTDSKLLSAKRRTQLAAEIKQAALAWGVGSVSALVIDRIGIAAATRRAMAEAVAKLAVCPDYLLLDWVRLPQVNIYQESFVKADRTIVSVAAASIIAKVSRDAYLIDLHEHDQRYGFARHKGYGTQQHLAAIAQYGPCSEHRHTFAPIARQPSLLPVERAMTVAENEAQQGD